MQSLHVTAAFAFVRVGGRIHSALHISAISLFIPQRTSHVTNTALHMMAVIILSWQEATHR
jgi:hypothetical protein